jgi:shikimate dehydrogenase
MTASRAIEIRGTTTLVGLLGWPTSHSLSPRMQNAAFAALALDWAYVPLPTSPELLGEAVKGLQAMGFAGANVTIPHKQAVISMCDELDEIAQAAGSVNTLLFDGDRVLGSSTDGDAVAAQVDPDARRALVLGSGGSALAVVEALERGGADVTMASRRQAGWPPSADGYDILVNATPVKDDVIVAPHPTMEVVDLAYLPDGRDTALVAAARAAGCEVVVDGHDVLLFQGAAAFERWTGLAAPLVAMREALCGS